MILFYPNSKILDTDRNGWDWFLLPNEHAYPSSPELQIGPQIQKTFGRAYKAGVKIAFGTDAGVYKHGQNWREFGYIIEAGMPAMHAIKAATISAAELLGMKDQLGRIEVGKLADIVAVDGDPLTDPKVFGKIIFVMKDGKIYKQQSSGF